MEISISSGKGSGILSWNGLGIGLVNGLGNGLGKGLGNGLLRNMFCASFWTKLKFGCKSGAKARNSAPPKVNTHKYYLYRKKAVSKLFYFIVKYQYQSVEAAAQTIHLNLRLSVPRSQSYFLMQTDFYADKKRRIAQ